MTSKNSKRAKLGQLGRRYIDWRNRLPLAWRIVSDIVSTILVIVVAVYAFMLAVEILALFLVALAPILIFLGFARSGGNSRESDEQWEEDNDPRGSGPRSMAPDYFS